MKTQSLFSLLVCLCLPYIAWTQNSEPVSGLPPIGMSSPSNVPVCPGAPCVQLPDIQLGNCELIVAYGTNPKIKFNLRYNALYAGGGYNMNTMPDPMDMVVKGKSVVYPAGPVETDIQLNGADSATFSADLVINPAGSTVPAYYEFDVDFNIHHTALNGKELKFSINFHDTPYLVTYHLFWTGNSWTVVPIVIIPASNADSFVETVITITTIGCTAPDMHRTAGTDAQNQLPTNLELMPNPTSGFSVLSFELGVEQAVQIEIFNVQGQLQKSLPMGEDLSAGFHQKKLDLQNLPAGIYTLKLQTPAGHLSKKFIKR
ncbi:MAG: T9SS type A sorting domain-containing protein [Bacteroidota bacterium]